LQSGSDDSSCVIGFVPIKLQDKGINNKKGDTPKGKIGTNSTSDISEPVSTTIEVKNAAQISNFEVPDPDPDPEIPQIYGFSF